MFSNVIDHLTSVFSGSRSEGGAKEAAAMLQQSWDYPRLSGLLPYRVHDDVSDLYVNAGSTGFILEAAPLPGANQEVVQALDDLLRLKLPRKTPLTVLMVASKCVGEMLDRGLSQSTWKGKHARALNGITRAFWERAALKGAPNRSDFPLYLRNYRVFIVYAKRGRPRPRLLDEVGSLRETVQLGLQAAGIDTQKTGVSAFLSVMREMLNYRPGQINRSPGDWSDDEELHRQCVDHSTELEVHRNHLRLSTARQAGDRPVGDGDGAGGTATRIVNLQLVKEPPRFALWQAADNLQNLCFPKLGIPCPFIISWTVGLEEQAHSQNEAFRTEQDLAKKAASSYAKLFPDTLRRYDEWRQLRQEFAKNEAAMCRVFLNVTLFCPDNDSEQQACHDAAVNVFRKNELELAAPRFQQMRNWVTTLPFMMQEGLWDDMVRMGATLRCKSFNAVNLMPVVADAPMSLAGSVLPTYRGQLSFFDMFSDDHGNINLNLAVTGTSGGGKSFFIQELLRQVLNSGGYGYVIDMGESYKNFCHQAGGKYLDGITLRFNPFANVHDISLSAEGITGLLTVLASPEGEMDDVSEAILQKGVVWAWEQRGNRARIDDVVAYLKSEAVRTEYGSQTTIMSRINELVLLLDRWCTWGTDGEYFNSDTPTLDGETRFAVLELLSLESRPRLLSAVLYSLILAIQEKMYHTSRDLKKLAIIDEAWRLFSGSNPHAAKFIETGYRTVRRHNGAFITITQGMADFTGLPGQPVPPAAAAAWNCSDTKVTLRQNAQAFGDYLEANRKQFSELEARVIRGFPQAKKAGFSSVMISVGEHSSFHRVFVDPVTRAMFSTSPKDFAYMKRVQEENGATSEEAAWLLASQEHMYGAELRELEAWAGLMKEKQPEEDAYAE